MTAEIKIFDRQGRAAVQHCEEIISDIKIKGPPTYCMTVVGWEDEVKTLTCNLYWAGDTDTIQKIGLLEYIKQSIFERTA